MNGEPREPDGTNGKFTTSGEVEYWKAHEAELDALIAAQQAESKRKTAEWCEKMRVKIDEPDSSK